jgi:hypothetical protein
LVKILLHKNQKKKKLKGDIWFNHIS